MLVHLMLELYGCDRARLMDEKLIYRALDEYPGRVDMEKVSPVHLYDIETSNPLDAGLSGFVVIAQSHISMHAWPEYGEVDIDICSCKEFSQEDGCFTILIVKFFGADEVFFPEQPRLFSFIHQRTCFITKPVANHVS